MNKIDDISSADIKDAKKCAQELEKEIKAKQNIVNIVRCLGEAEHLHHVLSDRNKYLEESIDKNKGYIAEAETRASNADILARTKEVETEAVAKTCADKIGEHKELMTKMINSQSVESENEAGRIISECNSRIALAKQRVKDADERASGAEEVARQAETKYSKFKETLV